MIKNTLNIVIDLGHLESKQEQEQIYKRYLITI